LLQEHKFDFVPDALALRAFPLRPSCYLLKKPAPCQKQLFSAWPNCQLQTTENYGFGWHMNEEVFGTREVPT
jgi:hypothetical protein